MLDAVRLKEDLRMLHVEHGIDVSFIQSLTESPKTARAHIRFYKNAMFLFNGAVAIAGLFLIGFGVKTIAAHLIFIGITSLIVGLIMLVMILETYVGQVVAIKEVEVVAKRHNLI